MAHTKKFELWIPEGPSSEAFKRTVSLPDDYKKSQQRANRLRKSICEVEEAGEPTEDRRKKLKKLRADLVEVERQMLDLEKEAREAWAKN